MSIPKVVGLEQEYAIKISGAGADWSPFQASCFAIGAYARRAGLREPGMRAIWDYGHETPFRDIRGELFGRITGREIIDDDENRLINVCLPNGARLYTDHAHPEYSTPECLSAMDAVACDKAGERILAEACQAAREDIGDIGISLFKNNIDHQGHSYGSHENYLMAVGPHQAVLVDDPGQAMRFLIPFLVTRQVFCGAGKVGGRGAFQISQRADFMESLFGLETVSNRPIVNTRGEHHADARRFRRLHLILGDANLCEFAAVLKLGATRLVLRAIEDAFPTPDFTLKDPVTAIKQISAGSRNKVDLADGRRLTALDLQAYIFDEIRKYLNSSEADPADEDRTLLIAWAEALSGLGRLAISEDFRIEDDPLEMTKRLDWVLKLWLLGRFRAGKNAGWDHPHLKVLDLQYHNIDREEGIFHRMERQGLTKRMLDDETIDRFTREPPPDTRAWFRGKCLERFPRETFLVNWEVVGFRLGDVVRMAPLSNPLKGTRDQFRAAFDRAGTVEELLGFVASSLK